MNVFYFSCLMAIFPSLIQIVNSLGVNMDITRVTGARTGLQNAIWVDDAFPRIPSLKAQSTARILDLSNVNSAGVVTSVHIVLVPSSISRAEMNNRVHIQVTYENNDALSFAVPIGAFFHDSLFENVDYSNFESRLFAKRTTYSFHTVIPMPFQENVFIDLINPTTSDIEGYTDVTYELFESHKVSNSYLFAYHNHQDVLNFPYEAVRVLPQVQGAGQIVAVNYAVTTNRSDIMKVENNLNGICEGNIEFFVDNSTVLSGNATIGDREDPHIISFTGSEDFFGQSYGFTPFINELGGCTYIKGDFPTNVTMSSYKVLVDNPIRFRTNAAAWIQWDWDHPRIPEECNKGENKCAVSWDITTFYYIQPKKVSFKSIV